MPSPFPGMDPYLESPAIWPDLHHRVISKAARFLSPQLRPQYLVGAEVRVYVTDELDPGREALPPDTLGYVLPYRRRKRPTPTATPAGAATTDTVEPVEAATFAKAEVRETSLTVVDASSRRAVTVLELVSPASKVLGSYGRASYTAKRSIVTTSECNLIEVDLLRDGRSFVPPDAFLPPHDYVALVSRADRRPKGMCWPIRLDQRLPPIPVPTRPDGLTASLDLQAVLDAAYDEAAYAAEIDYAADPVPPLPSKWRGWSKKLLAGRRRPRS